MVVRRVNNTELKSINSADYDRHRDRIEHFRQANQWNEMLFHCRAAAGLKPADRAIQVFMGDALLGLGRWSEATDAYKAVLKDQSQDRLLPDQSAANVYQKLAIALAQLGKIGESDDYYAQFLALAPEQKQIANGFTAQRQAGDFFFRQNDFEQAKAAYQRAVELEPKDSWARINLGRILHRLEQTKPAIAALYEAVKIDDQNAAAYYHLSTVLLEQKAYEEAKRLCQQALEIDADNTLISQLIKQIEVAKNAPQQSETALPAITDVQESAGIADSFNTNIHTDSLQYHYRSGHQLFIEARWEEAVAAYQRAIDLNANFYLAHYALGNAFAHLERWAEAVAAYQKTLALMPNLHNVVDILSQAIVQQHKQQPAAIRDLLEALSTDFQNPALHVELADAFYRHSYLNDAISHYRTALNLSPLISKTTQAVEQKLEIAIARRNRLEQSFYEPVATPANYAAWVLECSPSLEEIALMPAKISSFKLRPTISILVPIYNPPEPVLREMIQSVLDQIYPYWELCLADDCSSAPHVKAVLEEYAQIDSRINAVFRTKNGHISAASNSALEVATGEFIALLDHDDVLTPDALYEVVSLLNRHPEADMIYSDEDKLTEAGKRTDPSFKPDWSPDSFLSRMYICHLGIYRKSIIDKIGGFRLGFEGSQDYDLVLRFTEHTSQIFHIPKVLYHWRMLATSEASGSGVKSYASDAAAKAISEAMYRRGEPGRVDLTELPGVYIPRYHLKEESLVSIIIPTRNLGKILDTCLTSIFEKSTYQNFEIILIDNGSDEAESIEIIESWKRKEPQRFFSYLYDIPFNFSKINNYALNKARGNYLLFLNNDVEIITSDWIEAMLEQAQRESIGAVGAKLFYPDDTLQHGGVIVGLGGVAGHSHKHLPKGHYGYSRQAISVNNYSAVTAACLMCRKEVFESVGGFEDSLQVAFNDIDLCLKIKEAGYSNVWLPHVQLYHYESKSRGYEDNPEKLKRFQTEISYMQKHWASAIERDPHYSPNLTRDREDYSIRQGNCAAVTHVLQNHLQSPLILAANVDSPQVGKCGAIVAVSGWLIGCESPAAQIRIKQAGETISIADINFPRPDVAQAYPNIADIESCGFQIPLEVMSLSADLDVEVIACFENGQSSSLCTIAVHSLSRHSRPKSNRSAQKAQSRTPTKPTAIEVLTVTELLPSQHLAGFSIDSPVVGKHTHYIQVSGWVIGQTSPVERLEVVLSAKKESMFSTDVTIPRPDVAKAFPQSIHTVTPGFKLDMNLKTLPDDVSEMSIRAVLRNQAVIEMGAIELCQAN